jgi:hypothetical protein
MEVSIFIDFFLLFRDMGYGYIELDDIDHLVQQSWGGGIFDHPLWRESYYFNMTDERSGITLITTIGMLPNKKRTAGFILLMKDFETILLKPLVVLKRPVNLDCTFRAKGLEYTAQGVDWRIRYESKDIRLGIMFKPVNKIFQYAAGDPSDKAFEKIGTQHYEQSGEFSGTLVYNNKRVDVGPCFGHRDHSWGIRDWSAVERYRLFCCTFSKDLAFNLWEGRMDGREFLRGYVYDGEENFRIVESEVGTEYGINQQEPKKAVVRLRDEKGRKYKVRCDVVSSHLFPPKNSILYENIARMELDGNVGYGLLEYLYHVPNPFLRMPAVLGLLREMMGT